MAHNGLRDPCLVTLTALFALLLSFRVWMLHGSLPQFSDMDNPASFSPDFMTRLLTYSYLCAFNAWLLVCPSKLSYDWQMGTIPLLESPLDTRNLATLALFAALAAVTWRALPGHSQDHVTPQDGHCIKRTDSGGNIDGGPLLPLLLTVLPFLPASNLFVPVGFVVAERVLYIPSIGFCLLVGQGFCRFRGRLLSVACFVTYCAIVILFSVRTWNRNLVWASREALFESGIRDAPGNAKVHYNYANLQKDLDNPAVAVGHYKLALELWPEHASAHNNLGTLMTSAEDAERHFRHALRINPAHPGAHFNLANSYSKRGDNDLARRLLERAVELDPDFCEAYSSLAALAAEQGIPSKSEKLHRLALSSDPRNADARNHYGTFLQAQGRMEEAVTQYQRALELQPNHTAALLNAARSLRSMKLNVQAESLYKRALKVQRDPQVMDNLAVFYINAGRMDEARHVYEEVQELFPDHLDSKVHHAQLLMQRRSFGAAEDLLLEALRLNTGHREALHQIALLYKHTNRTTLALDSILKALRLCAVADKSCAKLHVEHGDILKDLNDLTSSAQSYLLAIGLDPDLAHAHLNLAVIRHLQGDYMTALVHYQAAFSLDKKNPLITDNMAKLRRQLTRQRASSDGAKGPCADAVSFPGAAGLDAAFHISQQKFVKCHDTQKINTS